MQFGREDKRDTFINLKAGVTFKPDFRQKVKGLQVLAQSSDL
jgi:hypothetical protein